MIRTLMRCMAGMAALIPAGTAMAGANPALTTVRVVSGLVRPVYLTHAPGDYDRLFILEKRGWIRVYNMETGTLGTFMNIDARVGGGTSNNDERGLLGLAFDPDYQNNGFFYVYYIDNSSDSRISRFSRIDANTADPNSEALILFVDQPQQNHNGGWISFGPDGYLYIALGDGGNFCDTGTGHNASSGNAQDLNTLLGKMLRLDVSGAPPYSVPADNPFVGVAGLDEIWAYGLRNPWRPAFDSLTGDLYIADVGQGVWEEVNWQPSFSGGGQNYGWRCMEGNACSSVSGCSTTGCTCNSPSLTDPIATFCHSGCGPFKCSITGGEVYRGCAIPALHGTYFYSDFCSSEIFSLRFDGATVSDAITRAAGAMDPAGSTVRNVTSFGRDAMGEVYIVDQGTTGLDGEIFRIVAAAGLTNDCNSNGVEDACDIVAGDSIDGDVNGVPDECEGCTTVADCADSDTNGIRDDNCVYTECQAGSCSMLDVIFGDVGGSFGACTPDGFSNLFDRTHVLTCFANENPCAALNIDVGGAFGDCAPDGFCNLFDASHVLTAFAGENTCACPGGPAPQFVPEPAGQVTLSAVADRKSVVPGGTVRVSVFAEGPLAKIQSYQLHLAASGGTAGALELVDVAIEPARDFVFAGLDDFRAFNAANGQMLSGLDSGNASVRTRAYLATYTYQASPDASGSFVVDVRHGGGEDQTFLLSDFFNPIVIRGTRPAVVAIEGGK